MELLLGCGNSRLRRVSPGWKPDRWEHLVTLDMDPRCGADVLADIQLGLPFGDNVFDEVHAYDVMEHFGQQGDYKAFFRDFGEVYRVLKPNGLFCGVTPHWHSAWLWNDPGHTRSISLNTLQFLNQEMYQEQVGVTAVTDYRWLWKGDFRLVAAGISKDDEGRESGNNWIMQAIKPLSSPVYLAPLVGDTPGARTN